MSNNKTSISKLKVNETVFEVGENKIKHITFDKEKGLIEISYESNSDWDYKIISIHHVTSIQYKIESLNLDPFAIVGG